MNIGLIFAGGVGKRMKNNDIPKQFLEVNNKPIIIHTLEIFQNSKEIDEIYIVCVNGWENHLQNLIEKFLITKVKGIVKGGKTAQESQYNGLVEIKKKHNNLEDLIVLIHDAVRPLINEDVILSNILSVKEFGNAITVAPAIETIINIKEETIHDIINRENCRLARAPQSFYLKDILECHEKAIKEKKVFIDSATMMNYYGHLLHTVKGPSENIKITTPIDYHMLVAIYNFKE